MNPVRGLDRDPEEDPNATWSDKRLRRSELPAGWGAASSTTMGSEPGVAFELPPNPTTPNTQTPTTTDVRIVES
jgi:hypothetical protein